MATKANTTKTLELGIEAVTLHASSKYASDCAADMANRAVAKLRELKVTIGNLGRKVGTGCPYAEAYRDAMLRHPNPKTGQPYSIGYIKTCLVSLRDALKTGETIKDVNKSRATAKKTGAKTPTKIAGKVTVKKGDAIPTPPKPTASIRDQVLYHLEIVVTLVANDEVAKDYNPFDTGSTVKQLIAKIEAFKP